MTDDLQTVEKKEKKLPAWAVMAAFAALFAFLVLLGFGMHNRYAGPLGIGQTVEPFELTAFDGETYKTADYLGQVIVLNFWASWCDPCAGEAAMLEEAWRYYQPSGGVIFLGVDYADTDSAALAFLEEYGITYPNGPDLGSSLSQMFHILGVPETCIIDADGKLAYFKKGPFFDTSEIITAVDAVLRKGQGE